MKTAFFWGIVQRVVVIPYRRFGTTCRSHIRSETSVRNCHYSLRNTPERQITTHGVFFRASKRRMKCLWLCGEAAPWIRRWSGLDQEHGRMWKSSEILHHDVSNCVQLHLQDRAVQYASGLLVFTDGYRALFRNVGNILSIDMPWRPKRFNWSSALLCKRQNSRIYKKLLFVIVKVCTKSLISHNIVGHSFGPCQLIQ